MCCLWKLESMYFLCYCLCTACVLPVLCRALRRYEGEFQGGYAHGLGQFTSESTGEVFIGEFFAGQRHGCVYA